jgi:two-component system phosphate regulon sensor histidine kinase PhoR
LPHVFERFYRVEKARSREAGGTGLGLSIVKHIIGLHGGEVRAESIFGKGTAIVIHLPMKEGEEEEGAEVSSSTLGSGGEAETLPAD